MHRFTIEWALCTTALGATYLCRFNASHPTTLTRRRPPLVLKCSSLTIYKQMRDTPDAAAALDDPVREGCIVARLIASGGHDNVVQCYDPFVSTDPTTGDECVCLVMEYRDGGDLYSLVTASPRGLDERQVICLMVQVVRGVAFLQSRLGLAHCDLSLENVFMRDGICKLADFGLATPLNQKCFGSVGKPAYMAPEVVMSMAEGYDPAAADVWSLGIMLFMLLADSPLVDVASVEDPRYNVLIAHGVGAILMLWGFDASQDLVALLTAMLQEDPRQRPSVAHVLVTLDRLNTSADDQVLRQSAL